MTPWVLRLLVANVGVFMLQSSMPGITGQLAMDPATFLTHPWTALTYMFVHGSMSHIFFNMLALYFFGPAVEARMGSGRFIQLYLVSGLFGALFSLFTPYPVVGASAAIFGVMLAFAQFFPRERIYVWGVLPIEARLFVLVMTGVSLYFGLSGGGGNIAHFAHLGGYVGGFLYLRWVRRRTPLLPAVPGGAILRKVDTLRAVLPGSDLERWNTISREGLHPLNLEELDRLRGKITLHGVRSLMPEERAYLDRLSTASNAHGVTKH